MKEKWISVEHHATNPRGSYAGLWTLDLVLSNKGPIWQATKIPAEARLALCGGGHSLEHSNSHSLFNLFNLIMSTQMKKKPKKRPHQAVCCAQYRPFAILKPKNRKTEKPNQKE
jgi:hypothetical protein